MMRSPHAWGIACASRREKSSLIASRLIVLEKAQMDGCHSARRDDNFSRRLAHGNAPGMGRAHHDALHHCLPPDENFLAALKGWKQLDRRQETPGFVANGA